MAAYFVTLSLVDRVFLLSALANCKALYLDFEGANLTRAENYQINAAENTLQKTPFSLPEVVALLHSLDIILED